PPAGGRDLGRAAVHGDRVPARLLPQLSPVPAGVPGERAGPIPGGPGRYVMTAHKAGADGFPEMAPRAEPEVAGAASGEGSDVAGVRPDTRLIVCAPLLPEARAIRRGIGGGGEVRVTGYGAARARRQGERLRRDTFGTLVVAGTGGGMTDDLTPG